MVLSARAFGVPPLPCENAPIDALRRCLAMDPAWPWSDRLRCYNGTGPAAGNTERPRGVPTQSVGTRAALRARKNPQRPLGLQEFTRREVAKGVGMWRERG